jgi:hypothetical protein
MRSDPPRDPRRRRGSGSGGGRENEKYVRSFAHPLLESEVVALGLGQHAVFDLDQLRAIGFTARAVQKRAELVTVPGRSRGRHNGIDIHRSTTLAPCDITIVNGIPCTTVARTLFDISEVLYPRPLERAFDQAEQIGVFDLRAIEDQLERNAGTRQAFERDRYNDQRLVAAGWRVIRVTWRQLERDPARVIAMIAALLGR